MKRLDIRVFGLGAGDAHAEAVDSDDGDLVWYDDAQERIAALEAERDRLRAEVEAMRPTDSDRTALTTAAFELKERRENYRALLSRCTPATDEFVVTAYKEGIATVEAAIEAVERLAKR